MNLDAITYLVIIIILRLPKGPAIGNKVQFPVHLFVKFCIYRDGNASQAVESKSLMGTIVQSVSRACISGCELESNGYNSQCGTSY